MMLVAGFTLANVSCTDYLDKSPQADISATEPYKNYTNFQGFVEEIYNCIPGFAVAPNYHCNWNFGDEEYWQPSETRMFANHVDQGDYWAWDEVLYSPFHSGAYGTTGMDRNNKGSLYGLSWYAIRKCNLGIANLDNMVDCTTEEKNVIAGQLYFFRGFYHFMLMTYWGGLPYVDRLIAGDEIPREARLNYQQTADKAAADFEKAAELLPVDWDQTTMGKATYGKNVLRINKVMALAFLGKNYLYAGSPLMNKESTGEASYNAEYCKKAAEAFGQVLKICQETGRYQLADWKDYREIFYTYNQSSKLPGVKEAIFYESTCGDWRWNQVNDYRPYCINGSGIKCYPTANYADYYGMANGKPIKDITKKDADSGYDPEYPFRNRDPRFYNDFVYDAQKCVKQTTNIKNSDGSVNLAKQYASLQDGGLYRTDTPAKAVFTGYMLKKFIDQYMNDWDGYKDNNRMTLSLIRLADVYLMYAEAVAQGYGSFTSSSQAFQMTALTAVNTIRERAGVGDVATEYLTTMDGFMSELRRERAVELSFEGHRFNDLRRWLLLDKAPYNKKTAVYFDRAADQSDDDRYADPENGHVLNLREETLVTRNFTDKHYWFPFLKKDVEQYEAFYQNPGWE